MSKMKRLLGSRAALALGTWVVYVLAFIPLYRLVGPTTTVLVGVPVVVTAWLFGMWAGLLAGLLASPLSALLVTLAGEAGWDVVSRGVLGFGLLVLIGAAVGRLRDLGERVKWELTERQRAEEALKEAYKELQVAQEQLVRREKLAVLGQLAGGVGHELRNPLGVISNAVYVLQMTLPDADETTATAREYLEMISAEVRNSTKIISDLLDFSRTRMPDREEVAVSKLVAEVLEKQSPPKNVQVTTEISPDLPLVFVDPRQMGQVLVSLATNAYQAMEEGGVLTISAQAEEGQVAISVTDTGYGISKEHKAKLFEPLFTTKARGIGLGLAVSRNLVEANGGSIEVQSEVGKGSTFTVRLPMLEREEEKDNDHQM